MKKVLLILLLILSLFLSSCYSVDGLEQYVGTYKVGANYKKEYHYYWGNTTLKSERDLISRTFTLKIKDDASVLVTYPDGETATGRVSCSKESIRFHGIEYIDEYTFKYKKSDYEVILEYNNNPTRIGLEYDYTTERLTLGKTIEAPLQETYTFTYVMAQYTVTAIYPDRKNVLISNNNYNGLKNGKLKINYTDKTFSIEANGKIQNGTFDINENKYTFHLNEEKPLIPVEREFTFKDQQVDRCLYLEIKYTTTEELEEYTKEEKYDICFYTKK